MEKLLFLVMPSELLVPDSAGAERVRAPGAEVSIVVFVQVPDAAELEPPDVLVVTKFDNELFEVSAFVLFGLKGMLFVEPLVIVGVVSDPVPTEVEPPAVPCQALKVRPPVEKFGLN